MKGLLIKDMRLVLTRKQQILILLAVCAMIAFTSDGSFVIGYSAGLLGMLGLSTLAFDERDNGFPFLFSLPVDIRTYVNEKYLFCTLLDVAGMAFGTVLFFLACLTKGNMEMFREDIVYALLYLPATLLLILSILPIQLIYGIERSRIITFVLYGILFVLSAVLVKIVGPVDRLKESGNIPQWMCNPFVISGGIFAFAAAVCLILYLAALKSMRNREF
jgi:hypothetical protein